MTTALDIMTRVAGNLQDPEFVRWTKPEMLKWITEAQTVIARTPGAFSKTKVIQLKSGTRQMLPSDGSSLITIIRNVEEDGTPLTPVRLVTRSLLDACVPHWHMEPEYPLVENYVYDDRVPKEYYVFPPNDGEGHLEVVYMGIPADVVDETQELELDVTFEPAIVSYVIFRAVCKESDYASGIQNATSYYQAYMTELSAALQARGQVTPNASLMPNTPVNPNGGTE